jgi:hypothetical protein
MTLLGRLVEWLSRRKPSGDDGPRIIRKSSERSERELDIDPLEELVRLVGEADASEPQRHAKADKRPTRHFRAREVRSGSALRPTLANH